VTKQQEERRESPRVGAGPGLKMTAGEHACSVIDISSSGIRFRTVAPLPTMSMVDIRLEIPRADDPEDLAPIHCQGAVVRTETFGDTSGDQEVAVFFTWIDDESRLLISNYVRRQSA